MDFNTTKTPVNVDNTTYNVTVIRSNYEWYSNTTY